ncbi:MAG: hypothetical protein AAGD07_24640 [Planctomycetota bacterium]
MLEKVFCKKQTIGLDNHLCLTNNICMTRVNAARQDLGRVRPAITGDRLMTTMQQDFGSVRYDGQTILLVEDPKATGRSNASGIEWQADGVMAGDRHVNVYWISDDVESMDDVDWSDVDRIEDRENPHDFDPYIVLDKLLFDGSCSPRGEAKWIATKALYAARGGHGGPSSLRQLLDLHASMPDADPANIVEAFRANG